jgi:hypothetical protein
MMTTDDSLRRGQSHRSPTSGSDTPEPRDHRVVEAPRPANTSVDADHVAELLSWVAGRRSTSQPTETLCRAQSLRWIRALGRQNQPSPTSTLLAQLWASLADCSSRSDDDGLGVSPLALHSATFDCSMV